MKKILIIEDDPELSRNIKEALLAENMQVETVYDGLLAERILNKSHFDCILLDINLPGKSGFDLAKDFRTHNMATPILMISAFSELEDKVHGYEMGADDYITKPFYMRELILKINSLIKRSQNNPVDRQENELIIAGDLQVNTRLKKVSRQETEISLTPREYQILLKLLESKGEIVSKQRLVQEIWGKSFDANTNTIEVYINFLRKKIDRPFDKESIKTKIGYGYYFED
ncbi:response regulator transcription factor [Gelidibacter gilvus]|uniref:Response regulator transcription factor n=1 Tax=Gelidibacter gilvus TaxID=59602 RepID=A0A4Q0XEE5_9FLAO|nr:response regulator transcription factor [Gelidibacter gilvus]RXJ49518.1 response regulator transcription factor [Gelidibacter gilvus]